jgi:hypothetical protein
VAAAVTVVVLGLGDRIVDVDGRDLQLTPIDHLVEPVHAGGGLLADAMDGVEHLGVLLVDHLGKVAAIVEKQVGVPRLAVLENRLLDAPPVFLLRLALPGKNGYARRRHGRGGMVLGGEDVA